MKTLNDEKEFMTQLMDMLEQQLGSHTEVVLHDLKKDYANTIVDVSFHVECKVGQPRPLIDP